MNELPPYKISALGDSALIIDFGNVIDETINKKVHALFRQLKNEPFHGMIEAVPGYSSLTVYYNVLFIQKKTEGRSTAFEWVSEKIKEHLLGFIEPNEYPGQLVTIPVCYEKEYGPDLDLIASQNKISVEEIIQLHTSSVYHTYMLGFLPGFAYMGMVDEKISIARKPQPVQVEAGSVGIAGKQTGIYPLRSPGGWQIIGRTPLKLFDKEKENPTLLKAGDKVQFYSITKDEFEDSKSRNA